VVGGRYAPTHVTPNPLTFFTGDSYGASQETSPFVFEAVEFDISSYFDKTGGGSSDNVGAIFEINYGLKVFISFTGSASYQITVTRFDGTTVYTAVAESIGSGTFAYSTTRNIRVVQTSDGVYDVFVEGVRVVSSLDASVDQGSNALGSKKIILTSIFGTYDTSPATALTIWWHRFSSIYVIGTGLPSSCQGVPVGIAHGFGGWISVFEDDSYTGSAPILPQALVVDSDSLKIGKEILVK
jgi:hypothetical protein